METGSAASASSRSCSSSSSSPIATRMAATAAARSLLGIFSATRSAVASAASTPLARSALVMDF